MAKFALSHQVSNYIRECTRRRKSMHLKKSSMELIPEIFLLAVSNVVNDIIRMEKVDIVPGRSGT